jgi:hypothetical protein
MKQPIFLSASVPYREPFTKHFDPLAIREAVIALVAMTVRDRELIFGGHPAISPLVEHAARSLGVVKNVHIYQSKFFEKAIPEVAKKFENLHWTANLEDRAGSLSAMRREMITKWDFCAAVFVGGMEGIYEEAELFERFHPNKAQIVLATTGGAAEVLLEKTRARYPEKTLQLLQTERRYRRVFRQLLPKD